MCSIRINFDLASKGPSFFYVFRKLLRFTVVYFCIIFCILYDKISITLYLFIDVIEPVEV